MDTAAELLKATHRFSSLVHGMTKLLRETRAHAKLRTGPTGTWNPLNFSVAWQPVGLSLSPREKAREGLRRAHGFASPPCDGFAVSKMNSRMPAIDRRDRAVPASWIAGIRHRVKKTVDHRRSRVKLQWERKVNDVAGPGPARASTIPAKIVGFYSLVLAAISNGFLATSFWYKLSSPCRQNPSRPRYRGSRRCFGCR
jgi:hypothetical protein